MKIEINCQKRWFEAQRKAAELGEHSLNDCLARCISFAMCKDWEVEEAEKEYERLSNLWSRAFDIYQKALNNQLSYLDRACRMKWSLNDRMHKAFDRKCAMQNGGTDTLVISSDYEKYSFYFCIIHEDGSRGLNGGIIFHNGKWQIHT